MLLAGADLVEIGRIRRSIQNPRFRGRVFGAEETLWLEKRGFPAESAAACFCAKEAFSKAVGTGLSAFDLREVQLRHAASGKPELLLSGKALRIARGAEFCVSITHTARYAMAFVIESREDADISFAVPEMAEGICIAKGLLKPRNPESNKGDFGRLLCVCGCEGMAGAVVMSARAAIRCGAGIVDVALPRSIYPIVASQVIEPVYTLLDTLPDGHLSPESADSLLNALSKASACLIGCGLGKSAAARETLKIIMENAEVPVVLDADGINIVSENIDRIKTVRAPLILTPHPGEMARLLKTDARDIQSRREQAAREFASGHGAILVLKGAGTLVASPEGRLYRNSTGNSGMARGGSGDVLAGMLASFLAQSADPFEAAAGAVFLHGLAGDYCAEKLSQQAMLPTDLIDELPGLFLKLGR